MRTDFTEVFAVPGAGSIIDGIDPDTGRSLVYGKTLTDVQRDYPDAVIMPFDTWCAAKAETQNTPIAWHPTTAAQYDDMLGVLPPAAWERGIFLVGEPDDHSVTTGHPRYRAYRQRGDVFTVSSRPITVAEFRVEVGR